MSEIQGKTVLITFGRSFLALHLARLLSAAGHRVLTADSMLFPITKFSTSVTRTFRTPRPRYEPLDWAQALSDIVRDEGVDLVVPIHEGSAILGNTIKQRPELFGSDCTLFFPHFDLEAQLENKYEFQVAVQELGMPTLDFALVRSHRELEALDFDKPFALKRVFSRGSQDVHKVHPGELPRGLSFDATNPWIAQEYSRPGEWCK